MRRPPGLDVRSLARMACMSSTSADSGSYQTPAIATRLTSSMQQLIARVGSSQAEREMWWLLERCTAQPLAQLQSQHRRQWRDALDALVAHHNKSSSSSSALHELERMLAARATGTPLQYVMGDVSFCGLTLACEPPTLIPRPETEQMVAWIIHAWRSDARARDEWPSHVPFVDSILLHPQQSATPAATAAHASVPRTVLDLCTGSGNIALALAHHFASANSNSNSNSSSNHDSRNDMRVLGVDIRESAVSLARRNAARLGFSSPYVSFALHDVFASDAAWDGLLRTHDMQSGSTECTPATIDLIVSNPPYIAEHEWFTLDPSVREFEDHVALVADQNGLGCVRRIIDVAARRLVRRGGDANAALPRPQLVMEVGETQTAAVREMCIRAGFAHVQVCRDWFGRERWVAAGGLVCDPPSV